MEHKISLWDVDLGLEVEMFWEFQEAGRQHSLEISKHPGEEPVATWALGDVAVQGHSSYEQEFWAPAKETLWE